MLLLPLLLFLLLLLLLLLSLLLRLLLVVLVVILLISHDFTTFQDFKYTFSCSQEIMHLIQKSLSSSHRAMSQASGR